jgi:cystathionine beta-lyase/cystathionine gamma-synthase
MSHRSRHPERAIGFHTRAAKTWIDGKRTRRPLDLPIVQATNFQIESSEALGRLFHQRAETVYTRFNHPTLAQAARKLAHLEGAEAALLFGSGMGAITTSLLTVLGPGAHVVAQREIFAQTYQFLDRLMRPFGVETDFVDATILDQIEATLRPDTALIYIETPSNPLLKVVDIAAVADLARRRHIPLFVDSTFASPFLQNPLDLGATLVLHSGTKFLGGHSDVMCGVAAGDTDLVGRIRETQILMGSIMDPHAAWLLLRGVKTLGLRVQRQSDTALSLARFLEGRPGVEAVHYPWLESSPSSDLARRQMRGGGGVLSFEVSGGLEGARRFLDALRLIPIATSLGGVETVIEVPSELDFSAQELGEAADATGIRPGLIRLSVGTEDLEDLRADLEQGLSALEQS